MACRKPTTAPSPFCATSAPSGSKFSSRRNSRQNRSGVIGSRVRQRFHSETTGSSSPARKGRIVNSDIVRNLSLFAGECGGQGILWARISFPEAGGGHRGRECSMAALGDGARVCDRGVLRQGAGFDRGFRDGGLP